MKPMSPGGGDPRDEGDDLAGDPSGGTFMVTGDRNRFMITSSCCEIISISVSKSRTGGCGGSSQGASFYVYISFFSKRKKHKVKNEHRGAYCSFPLTLRQKVLAGNE